MRMQIKAGLDGSVTLRFSHVGDLCERTFICPPDGGYVREYINGDWKQVCEKLSNRGSTLICSSREKLPDLIRKQYRILKRAQEKEFSY